MDGTVGTHRRARRGIGPAALAGERAQDQPDPAVAEWHHLSHLGDSAGDPKRLPNLRLVVETEHPGRADLIAAMELEHVDQRLLAQRLNPSDMGRERYAPRRVVGYYSSSVASASVALERGKAVSAITAGSARTGRPHSGRGATHTRRGLTLTRVVPQTMYSRSSERT